MFPRISKISTLILIMVMLPIACNSNRSINGSTPGFQNTPSGTQSSEVVSTPVVDSAPQDATLDLACRITINLFFNYKQGDDPQAYRDLFVESSKNLADSTRPFVEARTILDIMPATQWWQENHEGTPIPGVLQPEGVNEYIYDVKYTGHYDPGTTPYFAYPDSMTITVVADGPDVCKIKSYGKG